jgi:hypothetical protein
MRLLTLEGGQLGDKPLLVITATQTVPTKGTGLTQEVIEKFHPVMLELQKDLLKKSTRSTQVFAEQSDHYVPLRQLEVIVQAIYSIIETQLAPLHRASTLPSAGLLKRDVGDKLGLNRHTLNKKRLSPSKHSICNIFIFFQTLLDPHVTLVFIIKVSLKIKGILGRNVNGLYGCKIS